MSDVTAFGDLSLDSAVINTLNKLGYEKPTSIQKQAIHGGRKKSHLPIFGCLFEDPLNIINKAHA